MKCVSFTPPPRPPFTLLLSVRLWKKRGGGGGALDSNTITFLFSSPPACFTFPGRPCTLTHMLTHTLTHTLTHGLVSQLDGSRRMCERHKRSLEVWTGVSFGRGTLALDAFYRLWAEIYGGYLSRRHSSPGLSPVCQPSRGPPQGMMGKFNQTGTRGVKKKDMAKADFCEFMKIKSDKTERRTTNKHGSVPTSWTQKERKLSFKAPSKDSPKTLKLCLSLALACGCAFCI